MNVPSQRHIPPPDEAIALPVDELGLRLLRLIVEEGQGHLLTRGNAGNIGHWTNHADAPPEPSFLEAISEAYDWLLYQGLVALQPGNESGWCSVTRRGQKILGTANPLERLRADTALTTRLHPAIQQEVREQILLGRWANAVFVSLRAVEIRVRELSRIDNPRTVGVDLMAAAFSPTKNGPLRDISATPGEQVAMMELFRGAFGMFRNTTGHRNVEFPDPDYAVEVVAMADLLHRLLDQIPERPGSSPVEP